MIIPSYEDWKANLKSSFLETHEEIECWNCNGSGESECCECGHENDCEECSATGNLYQNRATGKESKLPSDTPGSYYKSMMSELSRLAQWQGKSHLAIMLPVAREIRRTLPFSIRLRKYKHATKDGCRRVSA